MGAKFNNSNVLMTSINITPAVVAVLPKIVDRTATQITAKDLEGVTMLGEYSLSYLSNLTSIEIPDSVTSIGSYVFRKCSNLTSVIIPDSVTSIGTFVFYECSNIAYNEYGDGYYLGNTNNPYCVLIKSKSKTITTVNINEKTRILYYEAFKACTALTSATIPNTVMEIGDYVFSDCTALVSVKLSNQITKLSSYLFYNCSSLASIEIPSSVTSIGNSTFYNCSGLKSVEIPDSVTSIGSSAFRGCINLPSVLEIPDSVTSIGSSAFYNCTKIKTVVMKGTVPPTISVSTYLSSFSTDVTQFIVPKGYGDVYKSATNWSTLADKIVEATE